MVSYERTAIGEAEILQAVERAAEKCLVKALTSGQTNKPTKTRRPLPCGYQEETSTYPEPKTRRKHTGENN